MKSRTGFAYRILAVLAIVTLAFAALPAAPAMAAGVNLQDSPSCPAGTLLCLPFLEITWGAPTSDPSAGSFAIKVDRPNDGSLTVAISQLQVKVSYAAPAGVPANAPPNAAISIGQFRTDTTTAIPEGGLTSETQVVFRASAADPQGDQFKLEVEAVSAASAFGNAATCSSPLVASGSEASTGPCGAFSDGVGYKWQYRLTDAAGASTAWTPFGGSDPDFTVDTTIPVATITGSQPAFTGGSADFVFAGSDAGGVASVQCQLDGAGFAPCSSPAHFSSLADGAHTFEVRAIDGAGNVGSPASETWNVDATAPSATLTGSPANPSNIKDPTFAFTGDDGAGSGVASFECQVDGLAFAPCTSGASFGALLDGSHTFQVRAIDLVGNTGTAASGAWVLDATAPVATITASPANPSDAPSATFSFIGDDGIGTGIAGFQCQVDAGGFSLCKSGDAFGPLADGPHTFEVETIDNAANVSAPVSFTWTIATTTPTTVAIQSGPSSVTSSTSAGFTFTTAGSPTTVECDLDAAGFAACDSAAAQSYAGPLSDGSHTFTVRVTDAAGHANTDTRTWSIDTTAPSAAITSSPSDPSKASTAIFSFAGDDGTGSGVASFQCQMDTGGFAACNSGDSFGPLSDATHIFEVQAVDKAGNTSTPASFTWTVDTTPPTASFIGTPAAFTGPSGQFVFAGSDAGGVATFECQKDGTGFSACMSPASFGPLADGSHTFEVRATDKAGNVGAPARIIWTVDGTGPTVTITDQPSTVSTDSTPTFAFTANDGTGSGIASFQCQLDAGSFLACVSPATFGPLADGSHTFAVRAVDNVGNVGVPVSLTWNIAMPTPAP